MQAEHWLPTKAAAAALGLSTDTLKRKREICGGFLEAGRHWCAGPTSNSPMTWCVEECRKEIHQRGMDARGDLDRHLSQPAKEPHTSTESFVLSKWEINFITDCVFTVGHARQHIGGLKQEREKVLTKSIITKLSNMHKIMPRSAQVSCRLICSNEAR